MANNNYCFSCETDRVLYFFFIHENYLVRFYLFHARSLSEGSNKSEHLAVSLKPLPNHKCGFVNVYLFSFSGSDVNTKGSDTLVGRLRKAGMYMHPAFIYLFCLLSFFVRVSLECKDVED